MEFELTDKEKIKAYNQIVELTKQESKAVLKYRAELEKQHNEKPDDLAYLGRIIEFYNNGYLSFLGKMKQITHVDHEGEFIFYDNGFEVDTAGRTAREHFTDMKNKIYSGEDIEQQGFLDEKEVLKEYCITQIIDNKTGEKKPEINIKEICRTAFNRFCAGRLSPVYNDSDTLYETVKKRLQR